MKKYILPIILFSIIILSVFGYKMFNQRKDINGLIMLIEFERIEGILNWEKELDSRGLTALISVKENILNEYPEVFERLAQKGYEIAGSASGDPLWDAPYEEQYQLMESTKNIVENITGKPMRVFSSRYFAYDENTLKAADALGVDYVLARGTAGEKAIVYNPEEYNTQIISVSNIPFEEMGTGSLCDYSLWARGATAEDLDSVLIDCIAKNPSDMIVVSHAYLGGTRLEWWNVYSKVLDSSRISWKGFNDWLDNLIPLIMMNKDIPINREVKYEVPTPKTLIDDLEIIPGIEETIYPACY